MLTKSQAKNNLQHCGDEVHILILLAKTRFLMPRLVPHGLLPWLLSMLAREFANGISLLMGQDWRHHLTPLLNDG